MQYWGMTLSEFFKQKEEARKDFKKANMPKALSTTKSLSGSSKQTTSKKGRQGKQMKRS